MAGCCSWKCFATGLLIGTLAFITIAMVGGLVAIPVVYVRCCKTVDHSNQSAVVYAAGPEHADVFLYQWDSKKSHNTGVFDQPYHTCSISYNSTGAAVNVTLVQPQLNSCLHSFICSGDHCIRESDKGSVVLYFLATAESYSLYNYTEEAGDYNTSITKTMNDFFNTNASHVILNESTQSVATWITANVKHLQDPHKHPNTTGVLYLGAASVQLSHVMHDQTDSSLTQLQLYGRTHSIYSDTRGCNGTEEVWKIIAANAANNTSGNKPSNPCLPDGYNWTVNSSDLLACNHTLTKDVFTFQGSGDYGKCEQQINSLIASTTTHRPVASGNYIALGKFNEVMNFFNTTTLNGATGWETYNKTVERFCQYSWDDLTKLYKEQDGQLIRRCYDGLLVRSLLMRAYGFTDNTNWSINFSQVIGTDDNTWSLGYMLEETQNVGSTTPKEKKKRPYSTTSLILSLVELVILLVLFSLFLISVVHVSCSDKHRNGYIAIS